MTMPMERTRKVVSLLPCTDRKRFGLDGLTLTIEHVPSGDRVIAERRDGDLVDVHRIDRSDDDGALVDAVLCLAIEREAQFIPEALQLVTCPPWCTERHYEEDDMDEAEHLGPGVYLEGSGLDFIALINVESEAAGPTRAMFLPGVERATPVGLEQLRALRDGLADVIAVLEAEEAPDGPDGPQ